MLKHARYGDRVVLNQPDAPASFGARPAPHYHGMPRARQAAVSVSSYQPACDRGWKATT
jgi:hypothetical protein